MPGRLRGAPTPQATQWLRRIRQGSGWLGQDHWPSGTSSTSGTNDVRPVRRYGHTHTDVRQKIRSKER